MIVNAIQNGGLINIYDEKGALRTRNGYLVSFTGSSISYITSKNTQTVIVLDDKLRRIRSFCAPKPIKSGPGWEY
ncbi:MAG: hypothetical protein IKO42_01035 [Opitutales bacterium]|nr:hypothetical protein [Opitutales bacterium]